ncbi:MAG: hypothetical protein J0J01_31875 [Reyranella sp.]|uniref:hypothetical protein n=1 Tax=Reyranella sp. TaxID=1929291 RepID=UPI001ACF0322|nr:hypothetical protein [Reyranella sp.]MBN9091543.1 hypothetical protein [Reyranella sp.]
MTEFEPWLKAQFAETGAFTVFIVLVRIADDDVEALKSTFAQIIGDDMSWAEMTGLLAGARAQWDGVGFFVGLAADGGPMADEEARAKLKQIDADVMADPLVLNRGRFFDRRGRRMEIEPLSS